MFKASKTKIDNQNSESLIESVVEASLCMLSLF